MKKYIVFITLLQLSVNIIAQVTTINHYSAHSQNHFGWAITGNEDYCFIADPRDSSTSYANGCVNFYKYINDAWVYINALKSPWNNPYSYFGYALSYDNDILAVSSIGNDKMGFMAGAVYIYFRDGDSLRKIQEIYPNSNQKNVFFGKTIKIDNDYLFIGAPGADNTGNVFIYKWNGNLFEFQNKLAPNDLLRNSDFGSSIACSGDTFYFGAPGGGIDSVRQGAVYIYVKQNNQIVFNTKLLPGIELSGSQFGYSLSANKNKLLVSAPHAYLSRSERIFFAGKVFLYENSRMGWNIIDTIVNPNPVSHDLFGSSAWLVDSLVVVSIPRSDDYSDDAGEVCIYKKSNDLWIEHSIVIVPPNNTAYFGSSLFVDENSMWVGLSGNKDNMAIGTVYYYDLENILEIKQIPLEKFKIYPNPVDDLLTIEFSERSKHKYCLYTNDGKLVKAGNMHNQKFVLNLSDLNSGIYMLSLWNKEICNTIKIFKN